ncbi:MAG: cell wall anchor protein [Opitutaceae bacterium]|nr:cell wall anchor protein [Opitutaceae bacterium]
MKTNSPFSTRAPVALLALVLSPILFTAARATIVFADDFNDLTNWTKSTTLTADSVTDTTALFKEGTDNKYLKLVFVAESGITHSFNTTLAGTGLGTTGQISFDFYDPQAGGNGNGVLLRIGTGNSNDGTAFGLALRRGALLMANGGNVGISTQITTYSYKAPHTLTVVFNNSASSIKYGDGNYTLAGSTLDVWLDGVLVGAGIASVSNGKVAVGSNIRAINFSDKSGYNGTLYIDNFEARTDITIGAAVPEPATSALLAGLAMLAGAATWTRLRQ